MGLIITSREYENKYNSEKIDYLLGNTGDWQKLKLKCSFSVIKKFTNSSPLYLEDGNVFILGDGTAWKDYGFDIGDEITISCNIAGFGNFTYTRNILNIANDKLTYDSNPLFGVAMLPYNDGTTTITNVKIWCNKKPQSLSLQYQHILNSDIDSQSLNSFIDGSTNRFIGENLDTLTGWQNLLFIGLQSGMSIRNAKWIYVDKTGDNSYNYEIELEFLISTFFEEVSNLIENKIPSFLEDNESITDNFLIIGSPEFNNPNTQIKNDLNDTKRLGNVGYFGENFNGKQNDFKIESVEFFDTLTQAQVSGLSYSAEVKIKAVISGVQNLANGSTKLGLGFIWTPIEENYYKNKETSLHQNLLINTAGGFDTAVFTPSLIAGNTTFQGFTFDEDIKMNVRNVHFYIDGVNLVYEAIWSPTEGFKTFFESLNIEDRNCSLWISVADRILDTTASNRVSIKLFTGELQKFIPAVGEWEGLTISLYEHIDDETKDEKCNLNMIIEDDILAKINFELEINNDGNDIVPNAMEFAIELENIITGEIISLQNYNVNLLDFPKDVNNVPQWNFNESRGFKYVEGNNKNWVKIQRNSAFDNGNTKSYIAFYGFKIRWEDWILRTGIPNDFFDALLKNNGFNNEWSHYLENSDYKIVFTTYLEATNPDLGNVRYRNTRDLNFKYYNQNDNVSLDWQYYRNSDNANITAGVDAETGKPLGVILDEKVRVEVLFTRIGGEWNSASDIYGVIGLGVFNGAGQFQERILSSFTESEPDNPLRPIVEGQKLKVQLISPKDIKLSCLIEPTLLDEASKYKLSASIKCNI